ncbi:MULTISPECIES: permease [unclassified Acinetobacter]|uniref:permease n=1 Tax=unclassified Acinetobacter TaxID=196816 RepID=UPI00190AFE82|nr:MULTISPECIES: permease [unclassified Acinetobacter]MBK0062680.1 permease [Acinetobacter sp. S55]MBK0065743.1 permease [Acinetobacter sp. S54]
MNLILPFIAFIAGLLLAQSKYSERLKPLLATLLARVFIPIVIIYNMVFYQAGSLSLMLFSFVSAVLLYTLFMQLFKDRLGALCFSYVNMAWLGFPFAIALFGPQISSAMVALYIGGSIFGNIWAVTAVSSAPQSKLVILKKVMQSPPFVALVLAGFARLMGAQNIQNTVWFDHIYSASKIGMTFAGMCVLGMWLRHTKVNVNDLKCSSGILGLKIICGLVLCSIAYLYLPIPHIQQYIGVMFLLFCLPPAANIVALETHYQGTGVSARYIASGTIVSCVVIAIYGVLLHLFK